MSEAGWSKRKLVSKPFAYLLHKIVRRMKAPPLGKPPKRNERPNEIPKIHKMSETGRLKLEYERQMSTNEIVVTSAEPPRAKIEKSGYVKPRQRRRIPRLSPP